MSNTSLQYIAATTNPIVDRVVIEKNLDINQDWYAKQGTDNSEDGDEEGEPSEPGDEEGEPEPPVEPALPDFTVIEYDEADPLVQELCDTYLDGKMPSEINTGALLELKGLTSEIDGTTIIATQSYEFSMESDTWKWDLIAVYYDIDSNTHKLSATTYDITPSDTGSVFTDSVNSLVTPENIRILFSTTYPGSSTEYPDERALQSIEY